MRKFKLYLKFLLQPKFQVIFIACLLVVPFQNCSVKKEEKEKKVDLPSVTPPTPPAIVDCDANPTAAECNPSTCTFDGRRINSGEQVLAFQNSTVPYRSSCVSEDRTCTDGALSGSYAFSSCIVENPASCLFDGVTIAHESPAEAYQFSTVPYGTVCQREDRVCDNGALTGSFTFASCEVAAPQTCLFNGQTISHGGTLIAFRTSSVPFGTRCTQEVKICDNGILSGDFQYASCNEEVAASCLFNGQSIAHGQIVQAFQSASVPYGSTCSLEARTCNNGSLSGTHTFGSCTEDPPDNCSLAGQEVVSGSSITAYQTATVPYGSTCVSESRVCDNGVLSGSHGFLDCVGSPPPPDSCLFNGEVILNGASVTAYLTSSVPFGNTCTSQTRTCTNGVLSRTYAFSSCEVALPLNCTFNGQTVLHSTSVRAFRTAARDRNGRCRSQDRTCTNGSLSGSYLYNSCQ